ncbi:MAG: beta-galactosidase [Fimbriimonadaceae bacterium]
MLHLLAFALLVAPAHAPAHTFVAGSDSWLMDGKPYLVRSGEMHYSRIPRAYWPDRLKRAKAMGLNTICTYVFWNYHEPEPGKYDFTGDHDVAAYVREAQRQGLNVILRPGPYVCSEWEWGGFPYWLANIPGIQIRQNNAQFLKASRQWLDRLGKELAPLTIKHGGPIILCQVENEYGSFGSDHSYMEAIHRQLLHAGFDCQMYTADGSGRSMLDGGTLPDLPAAINFGGGAPGEFANLASFRKAGPRMNGEFWCGWFDHWGESHHTSDAQDEARDLEWMLSRGDSVNLYMAHGGTTFGWMQGANSGGPNHYQPDTTSYDYDAPIAEDGTLTQKFWAFRAVFAKHLNPGETIPDPPADKPHIVVTAFHFGEYVDLPEQLPKPIVSDRSLSFEELHHPYGLVVYAPLDKVAGSGTITLDNLQDEAFVASGNGQESGVASREQGVKTLRYVAVGAPNPLLVAVEHLGRINFSRALLKERVGITGAEVNGAPVKAWNIYPIDLEHIDRYRFHPIPSTVAGPPTTQMLLYRGRFTVSALGDTYLHVEGTHPNGGTLRSAALALAESGSVWVNGHNLGRWASEGPQQTLYCPAPFLKLGVNEIVVLNVAGRFPSINVTSHRAPMFGPAGTRD